jgi:hypothetical protein
VDTQDLLTVRQAAQELNVTEGAIRAAITDGRLKHLTELNRKVVTRAELDAYKQRTQPDGVKHTGRPRGSKRVSGMPEDLRVGLSAPNPSHGSE